jgi:Tol biopolymer transport system component
MSMRSGYISVWGMNADGSGQTNLTPKDAGGVDSDWISRAPSWSKNGRQIYFMSSPATHRPRHGNLHHELGWQWGHEAHKQHRRGW